MKTISQEEFAKKYGEVGLGKIAPVPTTKTIGQKTKEVGVGFAKGLGETGLALGSLAETVQMKPARDLVVAAIDPKRTYSQVRNDTSIKTGVSNLIGGNVEEKLKANTPYEKGGKALEFIAGLLIPTGAGSKIVSKGGSVFDGVGSRLSQVSDDLVEDGVKVKDKIGEILVNLDEKTKTALDRTPIDVFNKFVKQGKEAVVDDRMRTPLESVGDEIIDSLKGLKDKASKIGTEKSVFLKIPEAFTGDGIKTFRGKLQSFLNSRTMIENDKPIVKKIIEEFKNLGSTPTRGQVDKFIDYAQDALFSGEKNLVQPTSGKTVSQLKTLISGLNKNLKEQLPEKYSKLNDEYRVLKELTDEINIRLGREGASAGSFVKRLFSPSDARTKELFDQLEKITGKDFTRDARLAKFVMESLGDTRAASILEQIPMSPTGAFMKGIEYVSNKLRDPIKAGERRIKNRTNSSF